MEEVSHRRVDVRTYSRKDPWKRKDVGLIVVALPVFLSVGWQVARWWGLGYGLVSTAALSALLLLLEFWVVGVYCWAQLDEREDPEKAELCIVKPLHTQSKKAHKCELHAKRRGGPSDDAASAEISFEFWNAKYIYDRTSGQFERLTYSVEGTPFAQHFKTAGIGSSPKAQEDGLERWGSNEFSFSKPEFLSLLVEHMLAPFFIFQLFCVGLWCLDEYWYYSLFTLVMLVLFECTVVKQRIRNLATLQQMGHQPQTMWACRGGKWQEIYEEDLLPGDIISISSQSAYTSETFVPADCLLLAGTGITNESILTGESIPQWKSSAKSRDPKDTFSWKRDKCHVLFRGTTLIQHEDDSLPQASPLSRSKQRPPGGGLICEVLRTGFSTTQGDLMRTILHSTDRMSANSSEAGLFILFLLVFALAASAYVLYHGIYLTESDKIDYFKLALNCVMIITSVIPPELPMELSLAVNTSMLSLFKKYIFCTEPFRIPFAGKVTACCFDKTGTLTSTRLVFEGVGGVKTGQRGVEVGGAPSTDDAPWLTPAVPRAIDSDAVKVLVGCHSLVAVEGKVRGDPMEKASFKALQWTIVGNDVVKPRRANTLIIGDKADRYMLRIIKRFHFDPNVKRMSTVVRKEPMDASQTDLGSSNSNEKYLVLTKGAPEALKSCLEEVPEDYDEVYMTFAKRGLRVIALGIRRLNGIGDAAVARTLPRQQVESKLEFCGFAVFSCPLKASSAETLLALKRGSHRLIMITGDAMLTACHVAAQVHIVDKAPLTLTLKDSHTLEAKGSGLGGTSDGLGDLGASLEWLAHDGTTRRAFDAQETMALAKEHTLCVPGRAVSLLQKFADGSALSLVLPFCSVFARTSPDDKEVIVKTLKDQSHVVLMCGDGTNDVGALKTAHVGIALLNSNPVKVRKRKKKKTKTIKEWIDEDDDDYLPVVSLGDASIASPFTSRFASVQPCLDVVKQGRSTLVTYLQMFKILGINCLGSAYTMSVMYLNGVKLGDTQATISGVVIAFLFMSLSNSSPSAELSAKRPHSKVFCKYFLLSMVGQFLLHFAFLYATYNYALALSEADSARLVSPAETAGVGGEAGGENVTGNVADENIPGAETPESGEKSTDFAPNLVNTVAYLVSFIIQVATFAVNYVGEPYNSSIFRNRSLISLLAISLGTIVLIVSGVSQDVNEMFELVPLPAEMKVLLGAGGAVTWILCLAVETTARNAFPERVHEDVVL